MNSGKYLVAARSIKNVHMCNNGIVKVFTAVCVFNV